MLTSVFVVLSWFMPIFRLFRLLYDAFVNTAFSGFYYFFKKSIPLPPVFNPTLLLSATQLAKSIRDRKMTSVSVVKAYISRISDVNPLLNAIIQEDFKNALQVAHRVDERIAQGYKNGTLTAKSLERTEPFLGVPFTVKDSVAVAKMLHCGGLISRRFVVAEKHSHVVEAMRSAGAILLAKTNMSELGLWWESENRLFGHTCNPYDLRRTPGGSSGGEAALMSACGTPLSIGTDVGGSIRIPAFFCGLFGHKPTPGAIDIRGSTIADVKPTNSIFVAGPITRHSEDLAPILRVLAGPKNSPSLGLDVPINLGQVKVYSVADDGGCVITSPVVKELRDVQERVAQHFLRVHDITVTKMKIPALSESSVIWMQKMMEEYADNPPMVQRMADNKGSVNIWTELVRAGLGRANHTWPLLGLALFETVVDKLKNFSSKNPYPKWKSLRASLQRLLGKNGVLLYPSHPTQALYHRQALPFFTNFSYTAIFNAVGLPVTQVPLGLSKNGLPLGIQVVGGLNMDGLTIAVAADLEKAFGGWKCPADII